MDPSWRTKINICNILCVILHTYPVGIQIQTQIPLQMQTQIRVTLTFDNNNNEYDSEQR